MKVLISSIGSRGDVQPILALALELRAGAQRKLVRGSEFQGLDRVLGLANRIELQGAQIAAARLAHEFG
jgi:hypothetical protein